MKQSARIQELFSAFREEKKEIFKDYFEFLRFHSISSEPEFASSVRACAEWLKAYLTDNGLNGELLEIDGFHPVVYASWLKAGPDKPTVLIYGHYDVQPVDPLELWENPPFEPTIRNGELYARGAQDNKGQIFYCINAVRYLLKENGSLPVNVKFCIEGEEEHGSQGLSNLLKQQAELFFADHLLVVDLGLKQADTPAVTLGIRGLSALSVEFVGTKGDLHSGTHGGMAYNPNHALVEVLAKLRDAEGRIAVPGFYNDVTEPSPSEIEKLNFSFDAEHYEKTFGAKPTGGEKNYSPMESNVLRPTLEINGIGGGYSGDGFKTVIPAKASAKLSCRLVPEQDPEIINELISDYIKSITPEGIEVNIKTLAGGKAIRTPIDCPVVQASATAYSEVFDKPTQFVLDGATIPITVELASASGAEVVLLGYGLPDDNLHAPNEHFGLDRFEKGFVTICRILELLGAKGAA